MSLKLSLTKFPKKLDDFYTNFSVLKMRFFTKLCNNSFFSFGSKSITVGDARPLNKTIYKQIFQMIRRLLD